MPSRTVRLMLMQMVHTTYRASTMSNRRGSVTLSHTSYACDFLNSCIKIMLKSSIARGSPEPSEMTTPFPWPLDKNAVYLTDDNAAMMYSSNFWRR